jgi:hypothetical protein
MPSGQVHLYRSFSLLSTLIFHRIFILQDHACFYPHVLFQEQGLALRCRYAAPLKPGLYDSVTSASVGLPQAHKTLIVSCASFFPLIFAADGASLPEFPSPLLQRLILIPLRLLPPP